VYSFGRAALLLLVEM